MYYDENFEKIQTLGEHFANLDRDEFVEEYNRVSKDCEWGLHLNVDEVPDFKDNYEMQDFLDNLLDEDGLQEYANWYAEQ